MSGILEIYNVLPHGSGWMLSVLGAILVVLPALLLIGLVDKRFHTMSEFFDGNLGYLFLGIGVATVIMSNQLGIILWQNQTFIDPAHPNHGHTLFEIIMEAVPITLMYAFMAFMAVLLKKRIVQVTSWALGRVSAPTLIFVFCLLAGNIGGLSVVVLALIGAIFFDTVQKIEKKDYEWPVVIYSAMIGMSALLLPIGEPLSKFIASNMDWTWQDLVRTYAGQVLLNNIPLAFLTIFFSRRAPSIGETPVEALVRESEETTAAAERVQQDLGEGAGEGLQADVAAMVRESHESEEAAHAVADDAEHGHGVLHELNDTVMHGSARLFAFVEGLALMGRAFAPVIAPFAVGLSVMTVYWLNSGSMILDNALLGVLEVNMALSQLDVLIEGISLAFWGVGLPPGNVCNIVLMALLGIRFFSWAKKGVPLAFGLALFNFVLISTGVSDMVMIDNPERVFVEDHGDDHGTAHASAHGGDEHAAPAECPPCDCGSDDETHDQATPVIPDVSYNMSQDWLGVPWMDEADAMPNSGVAVGTIDSGMPEQKMDPVPVNPRSPRTPAQDKEAKSGSLN